MSCFNMGGRKNKKQQPTLDNVICARPVWNTCGILYLGIVRKSTGRCFLIVPSLIRIIPDTPCILSRHLLVCAFIEGDKV